MAFRTMQSLLHALPKPSTYYSSRCLVRLTTTNEKSITTTIAPVPFLTPPPLSCMNFTKSLGLSQKIINQMHNYNFQPCRNFHLLINQAITNQVPTTRADNLSFNQIRTVIKFSMRKGRRKTVRAAVTRFYRLDWGIWIRPRSGRHKKIWKKGKLRKKKLKQHVFTSAWQTRVLERMTTKYWHKKKYWVDDPYESYHKRDSFYVTKGIKNIVHQLD